MIAGPMFETISSKKPTPAKAQTTFTTPHIMQGRLSSSLCPFARSKLHAGKSQSSSDHCATILAFPYLRQMAGIMMEISSTRYAFSLDVKQDIVFDE